MAKKNKAKSTSSASQTSKPKFLEKKWVKWTFIWWPLLALILVLAVAGLTKYIWENDTIYALMAYLVKAIGVVMLVLYVIYTRLLANETKKMAETSISLYKSEKGTVMTELIENTTEYNILDDCLKKIIREIHLVDKKIPEAEYDKMIADKSIPAVTLKIKNISPRRIEVSKIEFTLRHTGGEKKYEYVYEVGKNGTIGPWLDKDITLATAPEGEIEIELMSVKYIDGGMNQQVDCTDKKCIERKRKPEL